MKKDYSRIVSLVCPTCACEEFAYDEELPEDSRIYTCQDCGRQFNHSEIIDENGTRVEDQIEEMKQEVLKDLQKDLRKALKGFK
ncbi:MAG: hypothetical protein QNJ09_04795 [Paracoccaceae bacterium]|nr:hypothetical protein [Paracoccaceae bacterium]